MRNLEMSAKLGNSRVESPIDRGRYKVLAVMTLYLVLAVAIGIVRNELHANSVPAAQEAVAGATIVAPAAAAPHG
jgi:hypothetical protein